MSYSGIGASNVSNISLNRKDNKRLSKNQLRKLKLKLKQASVSGNVGDHQSQHNIQSQTTSLNAAAFKQNNNTQGRTAVNNNWRQKQNLATQAATSQGRSGVRQSLGQGHGQGHGGGPHPQQNSLSRDDRPPITCRRCLSRKGTHISDNCPSNKFCSFCKNGSHNYDDCSKRPKN